MLNVFHINIIFTFFFTFIFVSHVGQFGPKIPVLWVLPKIPVLSFFYPARRPILAFCIYLFFWMLLKCHLNVWKTVAHFRALCISTKRRGGGGEEEEGEISTLWAYSNRYNMTYMSASSGFSDLYLSTIQFYQLNTPSNSSGMIAAVAAAAAEVDVRTIIAGATTIAVASRAAMEVSNLVWFLADNVVVPSSLQPPPPPSFEHIRIGGSHNSVAYTEYGIPMSVSPYSVFHAKGKVRLSSIVDSTNTSWLWGRSTQFGLGRTS